MQFNENGISLTIDGVEYDFIIKQTDAQTASGGATEADDDVMDLTLIEAEQWWDIDPMITESGDQIWNYKCTSNNSNITATWNRGTLTISGSGVIGGNYISGKYPWTEENEKPLLEIYHLVIGNGITEIGERAFKEKQLETVSFSDSVITIGDGAFYKNQLTSVIIPDSVTSIGYIAFSYNQLSSVTIPGSVTSISSGAFSNNQLTSVIIPDSVTSIEDYAFGDNQLTSVTIPNSITAIGYAAFINNKLTSVTIPSHITTLEAGTFMGNPLTSITIGANVTFNEGPGELQWAFSGTFDDAYNNNGKQAGTYTLNNGVWTKQ
jgi:hypothetical protein